MIGAWQTADATAAADNMARTRKTLAEQLSRFIVNESGCHIWQGTVNEWGYGGVFYQGKKRAAHRLSYELHVGPIPEGLLIRHTCHTPACINPAHLVPGTDADNNLDCKLAGRQRANPSPKKGEQHWNSKITDADVQRIRDLADAGYSTTTIAKIFNLKWEHVRKIKNRETRKV